MDLADAKAQRPVLGKTAYRERVRAVCKTQKAQTVAKNQTMLMKRVCRMVLKKKGGATAF